MKAPPLGAFSSHARCIRAVRHTHPPAAGSCNHLQHGGDDVEYEIRVDRRANRWRRYCRPHETTHATPRRPVISHAACMHCDPGFCSHTWHTISSHEIGDDEAHGLNPWVFFLSAVVAETCATMRAQPRITGLWNVFSPHGEPMPRRQVTSQAKPTDCNPWVPVPDLRSATARRPGRCVGALQNGNDLLSSRWMWIQCLSTGMPRFENLAVETSPDKVSL